ncbi:MAG: hypothetical protein Q8O35_02475 [Humidesulfovibrio sp.]|uniref:hypothetical protein n=1 Tax=Humidesulfovibrio sp. TaxID=2910988 RepID=UPI0027337608|nr:hypothetical protein [Humidesulfovibrio sp.]MDP2847040.1 hypothetical protein [Humidesulfovibrio sp.]
MSLNYNIDGFELAISAGVSDEKLGKRRWTQVAASYLGWPCSDLEPLAGLKAVLDCFLRGRLPSGEPGIILGTEHEGLRVTVRQKDKVQFLQVCRVARGNTEAERFLSYFEVSRLTIAVNKALQALSPSSIWGPEPEQK